MLSSSVNSRLRTFSNLTIFTCLREDTVYDKNSIYVSHFYKRSSSTTNTRCMQQHWVGVPKI